MTPEQYLLTCLAEECCETAHASARVLRFAINHSAVIGGPTNLDNLRKEYNELLAVVELLGEHNVVISRDEEVIHAKKLRLREYAQYSRMLGTLTGDI